MEDVRYRYRVVLCVYLLVPFRRKIQAVLSYLLRDSGSPSPKFWRDVVREKRWTIGGTREDSSHPTSSTLRFGSSSPHLSTSAARHMIANHSPRSRFRSLRSPSLVRHRTILHRKTVLIVSLHLSQQWKRRARQTAAKLTTIACSTEE